MASIRNVLMAASVATALMAQAAGAVVLSFEQTTSGPFAPYFESGFSVTDGGRFIPVDNGAMHFDIAGGPYTHFRDIVSVSGSRFALTSLDILAIGPTLASGGILGGPRPDISFIGYLGGQAVAWAWGSSQIGDNVMSFGSAFANIDRLHISGFWAGNIAPGIVDVHFTIDNVNVAPVPLPAAGGLGLIALAGLGLLRSRRRA